jgi:diacylglycerol kinase (ATP)
MGSNHGQSMYVIVNPIAGKGFGAKAVAQIEQCLAGHGLQFDLVTTARAGEAVELARQAMEDGYKTIVAAGGDGTYQEVINGMLAASEDEVIGTLGVIPVGSGCDFSWTVGVPPDLAGACARLARGQTRIVDLGTVTVDATWPGMGDPVSGPKAASGSPTKTVTRYFDNTVGIGFDGVVTNECRKFKRLHGLAMYIVAVLKTVFLSFKAPRSVVEYELDSHEPHAPSHAVEKPVHLEKTVLMATICNGQREGGGFYIAPAAANDDGLFDLCLADNIPRLQILGMIPHFMKGTHVDKPPVTMLRSRHVVISSPDPLIAHADGEMLCIDAHRIECEIAARRVRVIC